jgi:hypothetical protein
MIQIFFKNDFQMNKKMIRKNIYYYFYTKYNMDNKPNSNTNTTVTGTNELNEFLKSLNEKERISLEIAKEHLGTSFDYYRCNGFVDWKKKQIH